MPSLPELQISLPRWIGIFRQQGEHSDNHLEDGSGGGGVEEETSAAVSESSPVECYACTQVGVPPFHSTSCDHAHPPEWEASAGSSLIPIQYQNPRGSATTRGGSGVGESKFNRRMSIKGPWRRVLDPRSKLVQRWNRAFLITRGVALAVDPLFFYSLSIGRDGAPCLYMDGGLAAIVTVLRTLVDAFQLFHLCLQLRLAYVSKESLVVGCGKLVWDASAIASHYLHSLKGFWFDVFVILPIPQMIFWLVVPQLIREEKIRLIMTVLLFMFLFQFLPKVYHSICIMKRMQKVTGYIFGTIWWGFALNLIAYFIASHVAGGCWYVLTIQRVASCLGSQCDRGKKCRVLACSNEVCYRLPLLVDVIDQCSNNSTMATNGIPNVPVCLNGHGPFPYGIYKSALPIVASNSIVVKILYPIFWGLMTLSTFGNDLEPTSHWLEVIFSIIVVLSGLMLFTLLIGNIQVFLHAVMARKRKMQLRCRDLEWWMRRRQLPSRLRQRVRHFERHRWAAMGGEDEMDLIKDLPEGLRRDIKRHLCVDLIRKVPLFQNLDDLILDNICDRVKPLVFSKDEKIIREGDPVQRMVFVVNGQLSSNQKLSKGIVATCILGPGSFLGDELLSWCLRRPFIDRLPASSATFICVEPTEAFGLDAHSLRFITEHFRYKFANERLKRTARYYSSNWRTWAAVNVQLAWRRYIKRTRGPMIQGIENGNGNGNGNGDSDRLLMRYAALFMSLRPHDHLE